MREAARRRGAYRRRGHAVFRLKDFRTSPVPRRRLVSAPVIGAGRNRVGNARESL